MNLALRHALTRAGLKPVDVAARLSVDPKTVERWLAGRVPHRRNRVALCELLGLGQDELWPGTSSRSLRRPTHDSEIQAIYPHRWQVPADVWRGFFARARDEIGILVYSGLFLWEDAAVLHTLAEKATAGVKVRLLLGDPNGKHIATRGTDEGIGDAMPARIRNSLVLLRPLASVPGIEIRTHDTTLYNSIFRADDELLINMHVFGQPAAHSPVLHVDRTADGGIAVTYLECFERIWICAS
jgi:hypothetical protein